MYSVLASLIVGGAHRLGFSLRGVARAAMSSCAEAEVGRLGVALGSLGSDDDDTDLDEMFDKYVGTFCDIDEFWGNRSDSRSR